MLASQRQLYQRICAYEFEDPSHAIGFLDHLMRANGWSRPFASRAIAEYRKFVFLALVADHQVTPSDQVDQVWHLHLLFSEAYWNDFCPKVIGRPLHHQPTKGGQGERDRFHTLYRSTIRSYQEHFGEPPSDLWPPVDVRFGRDLRLRRGPNREVFWSWRSFRSRRGFMSWNRWQWSVTMGGLLISVAMLGNAVASAASESGSLPGSGGTSPNWLPAWALLLGIAWLASHFLRPLLRQPGEGGGMPALNELELAYLARGPGGALEVALTSLVQDGVLLPNLKRRSLVALGESAAPPQELARQMMRVHHRLRGRASAEVTHQQIISPAHYDFSALVASLQRRQLLLKGLRKTIATFPGDSPALRIIIPVIFALSLNHPQQTWVYLAVAPAVALSLALWVPSGHTLWAERVLDHYRTTTAHGEALQRVALVGAEAMTGGRLDCLRTLIKTEEAEASSCGCGC